MQRMEDYKNNIDTDMNPPDRTERNRLRNAWMKELKQLMTTKDFRTVTS